MPIRSSANHGIEIGRRALHAQQAGLNATGHNIANANTPGFSRRSVVLENVISGTQNGLGAGADVASIQRQRSSFDDAQMRVQQQVLGRWEALEKGMASIEGVFNEPVGAGAGEAGAVFNEPLGLGISGSLSRFWNAWQDLANMPESGAARAAVRQEADFLINTMHQYDGKLSDIKSQVDQSIIEKVEEVNGLLDQLAELNDQLPEANFGGVEAADLKDRRDLLVDQLSNQIDVSLIEQDNGQLSILVSGRHLLEGDSALHLEVRQSSEDGRSFVQVMLPDGGGIAPIGGGQLLGFTELAYDTIPDFVDRIDQMALSIVEGVNSLHRSGYGLNGSTGVNFFAADKLRASNISISDNVLADLNSIAASADGNSGDNELALSISSLRNSSLMREGTQTIEGFHNEMLGEIGAKSREAQTMAENNRLFADQIENRRQGIQGVSLNDEASQLVLYQRAYQAAARAVSIIDDLMEVAINI